MNPPWTGELDSSELSRVLVKSQNSWWMSSGFTLFYLTKARDTLFWEPTILERIHFVKLSGFVILSCCHKSWLGEADFTWLIGISHRYVIVSRYDVSWLIVLTWLWNRELLLSYDWFIFWTTHNCESYDVMTPACDSDNESRVSHMRLIWVVW